MWYSCWVVEKAKMEQKRELYKRILRGEYELLLEEYVRLQRR